MKACTAIAVLICAFAARAEDTFRELRWRSVGPYRGGRTKAAAGVPGKPGLFYVGAVNGGVWRSDDYGRTWTPIFDGQPTGSIGALAVAPSSPDVLYVASGEGLQRPDLSTGDGIYKSIDGGLSWRHLGLRRGLYKSVDGGTTWKPLTRGLPDFAHDGLGRIGLGLAPSRPSRLFATVQVKDGGFLYRTDDAGQSWTRICEDPRVAERPDDFAEVKVDPANPDIVYSASVVTWKSTDGGKTFSAFRGAPGGDDYHRLWIDPVRPGTILLASDQGAVITVNGGASWSSWYNQPTAQMFHVTADNAFPYRLCGGQQESGSACVPSRGSGGARTLRDWPPAAFEEYGYAAPDPVDPDIVFRGKLSRWDRRTGRS